VDPAKNNRISVDVFFHDPLIRLGEDFYYRLEEQLRISKLDH